MLHRRQRASHYRSLLTGFLATFFLAFLMAFYTVRPASLPITPRAQVELQLPSIAP